MNDSAKRPDGLPERRRANRAALRLNATVRVASRSRVQARLLDISTHGCRVQCTAPSDPDSWLWLSIAGLETQYCRVVWRCEEFAGLEFAQPIAEAVLDRLLASHEQLTESTIKELRDIAGRTHWLAARAGDSDIHRLAEISRECAVDAVVEGLRLTESKRRDAGRAG